MIERLQATLRDLANDSGSAPDHARTERLRDDCADAMRLALDCMQNELTRAQRQSLAALNALLEEHVARDEHAFAAEVRRAAIAACDALGIT